MFKDMFVVDECCKKVIYVRHRGAMARLGQEQPILELKRVAMKHCQLVKENCSLYDFLLFELFNNAMYLCPDFYGFTDCEKLCVI
jgi:hypothetical protein